MGTTQLDEIENHLEDTPLGELKVISGEGHLKRDVGLRFAASEKGSGLSTNSHHSPALHRM